MTRSNLHRSEANRQLAIPGRDRLTRTLPAWRQQVSRAGDMAPDGAIRRIVCVCAWIAGLWRAASMTTLLLLAGCGNTRLDLPGASDDPALYATIFPDYIEVCAVSGITKKPGFGFAHQGGSGGHAVVYLNGACRKPHSDYPTLQLCDGTEPDGQAGVGLSSNGHFSNAAWVATPGRDFFFDGALQPGESVNAGSYARTQFEAKRLGIYDGVRFHPDAFADRPDGITQDNFRYEVSVATDYAISLGRGRLCARQPVTPAQMQRVVSYLNAQNARYRDGGREFDMTVLGNNCSHFTHNVLAAAGLWAAWPTDRFFLISAFSFPVPKNEFVNQMRRSNDLPLDDPVMLFRDATARRELLRDDWLANGPGAIATAVPIRTPNDLYDTDVKLIFYDSLILGSYQRQFDRIATERRYTDLAENLRYFAGIYRRTIAERRSADWWRIRAGLPSADAASFVLFKQRYDEHTDRINEQLERARLALQQGTHAVTRLAHAAPRGAGARVDMACADIAKCPAEPLVSSKPFSPGLPPFY